MRISAYERKLEAMLLSFREQGQTMLQQSGRRKPGGRFSRRLRFGLSGKAFGKVRDQRRNMPLVAQQIDRTVARDRHHPCHGPTAGGTELACPLPDADEHVLQRLFSERASAQDTREAGKKNRRHELVQPLQGARIRRRAATQQAQELLVEFGRRFRRRFGNRTHVSAQPRR